MKILNKFFSKPADLILLIFFILFSFGQLQRVQLPNNMAFYLHDILIVGWLGFNYFLNRDSKKKRKKLFKIVQKFFAKNKLFLYFLIWAGFSSLLGLFSNRVGLRSLLYICRLVIYILFVINLNLKKGFVVKGFVVASLFMSLMGILQYLFLPDTRFLNILGWDNHYYRLIGPLLDPAFMGMVAVLGLVGLENIWNKLKNKERKNLKTSLIVAELLLITTIALTFSRSSYLSLAVVLGLLFWKHSWQKKWQMGKRYVLFGFIFLIMLPLLPKPSGAGVDLSRIETLEARVENSQSGLEVLKGAQWIWGRGIFNNDSVKPSYTFQHAQTWDNLFVFLLNGVGIGGTLLFLSAFWQWGVHNEKWWVKNPIWTIGLIAVLTHSMFNNTFLHPFIFLMLWGARDFLANRS